VHGAVLSEHLQDISVGASSPARYTCVQPLHFVS
jgi:hypothetical protein